MTNNRKKHIYIIIGLSSFVLIVWKTLSNIGLIETTEISNNVWWTALLLFGAMITGFLFQPMVKSSFPGMKDTKVMPNPKLHLKDHETLMGYYPIVAFVLLVGYFIVSPFLYDNQYLLEIKSVHFWWSAFGTGVLNVFIFYFLTKGLRYGDVSLVSVTLALSTVFVLPISILIYKTIGDSAPIGNPSVTIWGFWGIMIVVLALAINVLVNKKKPSDNPPVGDFFAHHPVASGILATLIASVAVNFDKVAIDSANPFLAGIVMPIVVTAITLTWTWFQGGYERVKFIFQNYWREFIKVGFVCGIVILIMNITLFGANVNYYASIKRAAAIFGTIYGIYVLREGLNTKEKITRVLVAIAVVIGIVLITIKG